MIRVFSEEIKCMLNDTSNKNNFIYLYSINYWLRNTYLKELVKEYQLKKLKVSIINSFELSDEMLNYVDNDVDVLVIKDINKLKLDHFPQNKLFLLLVKRIESRKIIVITSNKAANKLKNIDSSLIKLLNIGKTLELKYN